jgi:LysR family transcriptional regulator for bpeEF and oprC
MDKLRAIQYFNRAVETGSFAEAARSLDVSTPAITHLVGALEKELGIELLHRTTRGISLTADGERYYESSRKIEIDLNDLDIRFQPRGTKPRGTLRVGIRSQVGRHCVMPKIARFLERYPDIELDTKPVATIQDIDAMRLDIAVLVGWPPERDLVVRHLAQTRHIVCASADYWRRHSAPREPEGLLEHHCLVQRNFNGTMMDRWIFSKDSETRAVDVKSWLTSDDRHWLETAACSGVGVVRLFDVGLGHYLSSGALIPVLTDWESLEAPTIFAAYAPRQRHSKLVRVFLDFLIEVFAELDKERLVGPGVLKSVPKPPWFDRGLGRQSAYIARGEKRR